MATAIHAFTPLTESGRPQSEATRGGKLYKGVTLIKAGLGNRRDKNFYKPEALQEAVKSGMFEGLRAFADHPDAISEETQPERSIRDIVGVYTNAKFKEDGENSKVIADLRVLRSAGWLSDMVDELVGMGYAENVGISINGRGQTVPRTIKATEAQGGDMEVHDVQKFVDLRSADIVTEAGAGGGFQQLLESAHRAQEKRPMTIKEMQTLHEAAGKGDADAIKKLLTVVGEGLTECACEEEAEAAEAAKTQEGKMPAAFLAKIKGKKKGKSAKEADEADKDEDETTEAEADAAELEAAADKLTAKHEGDDEADVDDAAEADADDEDEDEDEGEASEKKTTEKGGPSLTKKAGASKGARKIPAATMKEAADEISSLQRRLEKAETRNARLAEALKVRQQTDRARKMLKESRIPSDLQPDLLRRMVGKSEEDMQSEVRFTERLLEARDSDLTDDYDEIEGTPSRIRESRGRASSDETETVLMESGLPLKQPKK
jgi:hypothetical protein